ncbi:MAG: neutral zinc metallopeptidase [Gemmatimonadaceae bacterium]|nr:neutral zinc metallopeptidase [Gemmatimonadaceae bacterium]
MKWDDNGPSRDLEDRRGESGGGRGGFRLGGGRMGIGGFIVLLVLSVVFKTDLTGALGGGTESGSGNPEPAASVPGVSTPPAQSSAGEDTLVNYMSFVLDDAQQNWTRIFTERNAQYERARLVLFRDAVNTGCGAAESAAGPFYCPADQKVYIDLGFYDDLRRRFGAPGDFAQAYVLAHELGHHVQNVTGTERQMRRLQQQRPGDRNALSVAMELQADCYAGIWGKHAQEAGKLEAGDIEEALKAASAVGDDRISEMSGSAIRPESFTHGSAAQRMTWFRRGFDTGRVDACDTFADR